MDEKQEADQPAESPLTVDQKLDRILELLQSRCCATVAEVSSVLHSLSERGSDQGLMRSEKASGLWSEGAEEFVTTALSAALQVRYRHLEKVHVYTDKEIQRQKLLSARVDWMKALLKEGLTEAGINHTCTSAQLKQWIDEI